MVRRGRLNGVKHTWGRTVQPHFTFSALSGYALYPRKHWIQGLWTGLSRPEKGVTTKGVFSLEESLRFLNSLESLGNGRILLYFPQSGGSLESLESLNSLESLEMDFTEKTPFSKDPFFRTRDFNRIPTGL